MTKATHASLTMARFDELRVTGPVHTANRPDTLFLRAGADVRMAASNAKAQESFKFVLYGLHTSEQAARQAVADRMAIAPWLEEASEVWSAVLAPFRHFGEANFLNQASPEAVFEVTEAPPAEDAPILIVTSVGWSPPLDMDRITRFSEGVTGVRVGMTGVPGLHTQQTFSFPGGLEWDGITVTLWQNLKSAMGFAYGPGLHRNQVKIQRGEIFGDRTSFTRFKPVHREGTWHGSDPLA